MKMVLKCVLLLFIFAGFTTRHAKDPPTNTGSTRTNKSTAKSIHPFDKPETRVKRYGKNPSTEPKVPWAEANRLVDTASRPCPYPKFEHGRFRMRQKSKLIKFICFPGYELAGNKYATCRDGKWDVPLPVCVRPGCVLPLIDNGIPITSHRGAYLVFFCIPPFKVVGNTAIYCDGRRWNATAPKCIESTEDSRLSCDFEDVDLCGWTNDDYHDFDWRRLNKKTPSSFLFTGPSHDHTLGENGTGYYIYIESTSRLENDTARIISPLYNSSLAKNGCFSFFYHMFGKTTGGLRIYQKPESIALDTLLKQRGTEMQHYLLFEKWGNQGDTWYRGVGTLSDFGEDFQIVIEGIRGSSFTSDIAIDDVALLQGDNCTAAKQSVVTPIIIMPDSCQGRCDVFGAQPNEMGCGCTAVCVAEGNCCPDFFEVCVFDISTTPDDFSSADLPQTQKLVAHSVTASVISSTTTSTTTNTTLEPRTTTPRPIPPTTSLPPVKTYKPTPSTTPRKPISTSTVRTTKKVLTTPKAPIPTKITFKTTEQIVNKTGLIKKDVTTIKPVKAATETIIKTTTKPPKPVVKTTTFAYKISYLEDSAKAEVKVQAFDPDKRVTFVPTQEQSQSSGAKTAILTITGLLCFVGAAWLFVWTRTSTGRSTIDRLRGRVNNDPDVRYLHSTDEDLE